MRFKTIYFCIALIIFVLEVFIATTFSSIVFIRGSLGDVLVVMLLFFMLLAFLSVRPVLLAFIVFVFVCSIELGQYLQLTQVLSLERQGFLSILRGILKKRKSSVGIH